MFQLLLEAPKHEIRYLEFEHKIEPDCIVHLVASAFPNLTELVLITVVQKNGNYFGCFIISFIQHSTIRLPF